MASSDSGLRSAITALAGGANVFVERDGISSAAAFEPTAQLDSETAAGIMELLREVAATETAVLMATHDRVAVEYADRVANMEDSRLAATSTT